MKNHLPPKNYRRIALPPKNTAIFWFYRLRQSRSRQKGENRQPPKNYRLMATRPRLCPPKKPLPTTTLYFRLHGLYLAVLFIALNIYMLPLVLTMSTNFCGSLLPPSYQVPPYIQYRATLDQALSANIMNTRLYIIKLNPSSMFTVNQNTNSAPYKRKNAPVV